MAYVQPNSTELTDRAEKLRRAGITAPLNWFRDITDDELTVFFRSPYRLSMSFEELLGPGKKRRDKKNPPRPLNSWIIFNRDYAAKCKHASKSDNKDGRRLAAMASKVWKEIMQDQAEYFNVLSKIAENVHSIRYPNYKYDPLCSKSNSQKRSKKNGNACTTKKLKCESTSEDNTNGSHKAEDQNSYNEESISAIALGKDANTINNDNMDIYSEWLLPYSNDSNDYFVINDATVDTCVISNNELPPTDNATIDYPSDNDCNLFLVDIDNSPESNDYYTPEVSPTTQPFSQDVISPTQLYPLENFSEEFFNGCDTEYGTFVDQQQHFLQLDTNS
jgi:hypothetical protein